MDPTAALNLWAAQATNMLIALGFRLRGIAANRPLLHRSAYWLGLPPSRISHARQRPVRAAMERKPKSQPGTPSRETKQTRAGAGTTTTKAALKGGRMKGMP